MKKIIVITLLGVFGFGGVASAYTQTWYGTDTGDTIILTPDVQGDLPTNYYTASQSESCSYLVEEYDDKLDGIDATRGVPSSVKNNKRYALLKEYNSEIYECLIDERSKIQEEIKELKAEKKELQEQRDKEVKVEKQPKEVELTQDKRTTAIMMILQLKASGESLTIDKLLPIIMMLRN